MSNEHKIVLTEQELEDIKDTIKFRTKIVLQLKQLNDIPNTVRTLKVWGTIHWFLIGSILLILVYYGSIGR